MNILYYVYLYKHEQAIRNDISEIVTENKSIKCQLIK